MSTATEAGPVLVVGATGTVGSEVARALAQRGLPVRALVRDVERAASLPPEVDRVVGDLRNPHDVARALRGARSAFYVSPHEVDEVALARSFVGECEAAGVRLVFAGVHIPDDSWLTRAAKRLLFSVMLPAYRGKLRVGEIVVGSAARPVVLVGSHFMQNDELFCDDIRTGRFPIPLAAGGVNRVDVRDLAEIAARALAEPEFLRPGAYPVVGARSISGVECAREWERALEHRVRYVGDDDPTWTSICRRRVSGKKLEDFLATARLQQKRAFPTDQKQLAVTARLLGRAPSSYASYVRDTVASWDSSA